MSDRRIEPVVLFIVLGLPGMAAFFAGFGMIFDGIWRRDVTSIAAGTIISLFLTPPVGIGDKGCGNIFHGVIAAAVTSVAVNIYYRRKS